MIRDEVMPNVQRNCEIMVDSILESYKKIDEIEEMRNRLQETYLLIANTMLSKVSELDGGEAVVEPLTKDMLMLIETVTQETKLALALALLEVEPNE